ncbi:hypothetical protein [Algoriphagus mannitolivorans]|uniref:hypothetical protein n=1 Tax=Algoriphagus mannitolivorans TaxID=226504 RepID=UPI00047CD286|nr:hypothetical protein [Algoriphagus mannitolivorans]
MKRRLFLRTLPILALSPLTLSEKGFAGSSNPRHLIALGTAASRVATKHWDSLNFDSLTLIDSEPIKSMREDSKFFEFSSSELIYSVVGDICILENGYLPILPIPKEIKDHLRSLDGELVFYAGLGKEIGSVLFQSLGAHYNNHNQSLEWLATLPFNFEGAKKVERARSVLAVLAENGIEPSYLSLEELRPQMGNILIRLAFEKGDEWILEALNNQI